MELRSEILETALSICMPLRKQGIQYCTAHVNVKGFLKWGRTTRNVSTQPRENRRVTQAGKREATLFRFLSSHGSSLQNLLLKTSKDGVPRKKMSSKPLDKCVKQGSFHAQRPLRYPSGARLGDAQSARVMMKPRRSARPREADSPRAVSPEEAT